MDLSLTSDRAGSQSPPSSGRSKSSRSNASYTSFPFVDTTPDTSVYSSAREFLTPSLGESTNNSFTHTITDFNLSLSDSDNTPRSSTTASSARDSSASARKSLIQSDISTSQEEVDPKSLLANKTIFKTDDPNYKIIEINENQEQDPVIIIESSDDEKDLTAGGGTSRKSSPSPRNSADIESAAEKRRRKAESLIHSSKQKLNVAIAEACAAESASGSGDADLELENEITSISAATEQPVTKREIKIYDTIEEFEAHLPSTVTVLDSPFGSRVYLVGTAHFSEESQDDVSFVIRNVRPDVVMVELCPSRIHILKLDEKTLLEEAKSFNLAKIRTIIQAHGYINGIFFILLLQMSAQIAKDLGMAPGGEFRRAFEEIHKLPGCILHLGDRPIRITLHRALRALSLWQTIKLVWRLTSTDSISIEEVEECKQRDLLEKLMQEMAGEFPAFSDVFVKERDTFLCHSLQLASLMQVPADNTNLAESRPVRVVGVVGIGHARGIAEMWGHVDPANIPSIMEIPPASTSTRICKYTIKYGLIGLTLFGAIKFLRPRIMRYF